MVARLHNLEIEKLVRCIIKRFSFAVIHWSCTSNPASARGGRFCRQWSALFKVKDLLQNTLTFILQLYTSLELKLRSSFYSIFICCSVPPSTRLRFTYLSSSCLISYLITFIRVSLYCCIHLYILYIYLSLHVVKRTKFTNLEVLVRRIHMFSHPNLEKCHLPGLIQWKLLVFHCWE